MKTIYTLPLCIFLITALSACKKEVINDPVGNQTQTDPFTNEEFANEGAAFYIIADVEGVPGQAKLFVKSDYYGLDRVAFYQCFGGGYSSYEVDMPRTSGPAIPWVNAMHFSFDSGMVDAVGNIKRTGSFSYGLPGELWTNKLRISLHTRQYIYDRVVPAATDLFEVTSIGNGSDYFKGRFNVTLSNSSGKTVTLKNGIFKIRT